MARYYYTNAIIWALLVIATLFSFEAVSFASLHQHALTIAMIFACLKAHLIAQYFMELRDAPKPWAILFNALFIVATLAIAGIDAAAAYF